MNDHPPGLPGAIPIIGGLANTMINTPSGHIPNEHDRMDGILRDVDRNLAALTERVANIQAGVDRLATQLQKIDDENITREEYAMIRRWLTGTTVGVIVSFVLACIACGGVIAIVIYLSNLAG